MSKRIVPTLPNPKERIRLIIDTDAANEIDDLYAIALALISSERFQIEGFIATHFAGNKNAGLNSIQKSHSAIEEILEIAGMKGRFPVKNGGQPLQYYTVPNENEGSDFIIEKAKESTPEDPIWILAIGAATNVASAVMKDPSITANLRCIFHARCEESWPEYTTQFNIRGDSLATMVLLDSDIPLIWFDTGTHIVASMEETEERIGTTGKLGRYLQDYRYRCDYFMGADKGFFDLADAVWMIEPDSCTEEETDVLGMDQTMRFNHDKDLGRMLRVTNIDCEKAWSVLENRLSAFAGKALSSKQRVREAVNHKRADMLPANFDCDSAVMEKLKEYLGYEEDEQVRERLGSDIRAVSPDYIGPKLEEYVDSDGCKVWQGYWGEKSKVHWTGKNFQSVPFYFPLDSMNTIDELKNYNWPKTEWFDYDSIQEQCERHHGKAITIGYIGPFQFATQLRRMDKLLMDMILNPEFAHYLFDRMMEFELEHYEKMLIAGNGQIDILKACDDYGTQQSLLFSVDMWEEFFETNTKKLVDLAHRYGALYHQHSCGAVAPLISRLIECGIDILEPLQKVQGMEPETLKQKYGKQITFLGGIDTQRLLPFGTTDEVIRETKQIVDTLYTDGGYILMASQNFQIDVPVENILAMYSARDPSLLSVIKQHECLKEQKQKKSTLDY